MRVWRTISLLYFGTYTIVILQFLQGIVLTVPVVNRSSRMVREVYPEVESEKQGGNQAEVCIVGDVVYGADEPVPSDQPCLKCKCQPPGVQCESIQCSQKQGCKAIHKSNQCCPEYQCECLLNGKIYGNGERLATLPGEECSVCYCRGGEVQCANVSCYKRADCEGHTVPGQCCPKYDHCPPKEPLERPVPLVTSSAENATNDQEIYTTAIYDVEELINEDNIIADNQPNSTTITSPILIQPITESIDSSNKLHIFPADPLTKDQQPEHVVPKDVPKITIQEIIPEVKEIPITTPPKQNINVLAQKIYAPAVEKHTTNNDKEITSDLAIADADSESSEISEIYHQPPPVLKIGDQLLIFKKGELVSEKDISTPVPVITIIGAEGLQRGTEDSSEFHEFFSQLQGPHKDLAITDDFFENDTLSLQNVPQKETHIISFIKQKKLTTASTPDTITDLPPALLEFEDFPIEGNNSNITFIEDTVNQTYTLENLDSTTFTDNETTDNSITSKEGSKEIESVQPAVLLEPLPLENMKPNGSVHDELQLSKTETDVVRHTSDLEFLNTTLVVATSPDILDSDSVLASNLNDTSIISNNSGEATQSFSETPNNAPVTDNNGPTSDNADKVKSYDSAHILINSRAALEPHLLKQAAASDLEDDTEVDDIQNKESEIFIPEVLLNQNSTKEYNGVEHIKETDEEILEDSGESTTARNNQTSELLTTENASVETTQNDSHQLDTRNLVEILPGFQITTENILLKEVKVETEAELIDADHLLPTVSVLDLNNKSDSAFDEDIFKQLNKELNSTLSSLNFTAFKGDEVGAEAIFKELLEEVTSSTLPPLGNHDGSHIQLHEKESQLLQKVSEAISKFQSKESKEALDARIMELLRDFFRTQHKLDSNKNQSMPVLPISVP